jgi:hypothetical protein
MKTHSDCYGSLFPDFTKLRYNLPLASRAFRALATSRGIGVQNRTLDVVSDEWEKCIQCPDYRTCYDLSLAKFMMNAVLAGGLHGV